MKPFKIVSATRADPAAFGTTPLGKTLQWYANFPLDAQIFYRNSRGLPACYNQAIRETADGEQILVFVHDDAYLIDYFWMDHLAIALQQFDVVGVAGNMRRSARQPSWAFADDTFQFDHGHLSGVVGHGQGLPTYIDVFGPPFRQCLLLDGVFLAARARTLQTRDLWFDERYSFHFYDLDFCRQAERKGVRLGTAPVSLVHASVGAFDTPQWRSAYATYLAKWGD